MILKYCGNEGSEDDKKAASMRRLLQALIDFIPKENAKIWKNATIKIYDVETNSLCVVSGKGNHKFVLMHGMKDEPIIKRTEDSKCTIIWNDVY